MSKNEPVVVRGRVVEYRYEVDLTMGYKQGRRLVVGIDLLPDDSLPVIPDGILEITFVSEENAPF